MHCKADYRLIRRDIVLGTSNVTDNRSASKVSLNSSWPHLAVFPEPNSTLTSITQCYIEILSDWNQKAVSTETPVHTDMIRSGSPHLQGRRTHGNRRASPIAVCRVSEVSCDIVFRIMTSCGVVSRRQRQYVVPKCASPSHPTRLHCVKTQNIHSFSQSVFCLTTGPKPPPKRFLHIVRSRAFSFK